MNVSVTVSVPVEDLSNLIVVLKDLKAGKVFNFSIPFYYLSPTSNNYISVNIDSELFQKFDKYNLF